MRIESIKVHRVELPIAGTGYKVSGGRGYQTLDSTIVIVETDAGISGVGESCPLGPAYLPAYAAGLRTGIGEIAPHLIGQDPRRLTLINEIMDRALMGHPYVKSPIDIACWDILGQAVDMPIYELMGGRLVDDIPFRIGIPISKESPTVKLAKLRRKGFFLFNLKVGDDPRRDIQRIRSVTTKLKESETLVIDANRGWRVDEALWVVRSIPRDMPVYFEQPCATYEECLAVRRATDHAIILDEVADSLDVLVRIRQDNAAEGVTLKISRFGGLTKARLMRDLCVALRLPMHIQDPWGSSVVTAAVTHLAHSTPARFLLGAWGGNEDVPLETATGTPVLRNGRLKASGAPGLGIKPKLRVLGKPIAVYR